MPLALVSTALADVGLVPSMCLIWPWPFLHPSLECSAWLVCSSHTVRWWALELSWSHAPAILFISEIHFRLVHLLLYTPFSYNSCKCESGVECAGVYLSVYKSPSLLYHYRAQGQLFHMKRRAGQKHQNVINGMTLQQFLSHSAGALWL